MIYTYFDKLLRVSCVIVKGSIDQLWIGNFVIAYWPIRGALTDQEDHLCEKKFLKKFETFLFVELLFQFDYFATGNFFLLISPNPGTSLFLVYKSM